MSPIIACAQIFLISLQNSVPPLEWDLNRPSRFENFFLKNGKKYQTDEILKLKEFQNKAFFEVVLNGLSILLVFFIFIPQ